MDETLRAELLALKAEDGRVRRELIEAGELYGPHLPADWYHPRMAERHRLNTARLRALVAAHGWPGVALAGADGAEAAWFIAQHAVLDVDFQQQALERLTAAVAQGDAPAWQMAMLTDRVRMGRGQPQVYGSIHVGDADGRLVPYVTEDPEGVEARRAAVGLPPLADKTAELKARVAVEADVQAKARGAGS
jgi:hypothetical protein